MSELTLDAPFPLVSIIVPIYNMKPYLPRCVDSLIQQSYTHIEIVLVDDGSTDGSGELCDQFALTDTRIRVIHKTNGGLSDARNAGLAQISGVHVSFVDSDDFLDRESIEIMVRESQKSAGNIVCVGSRILDDHGNLQQCSATGSLKTVIFTPLDYIRGICRKYCSESVCDKLFPREIFQTHRFEKGRLNEDFFLLSKILLSGFSVCCVDYAGYNYIKHGISITADRSNFRSLRDAIRNSSELLKLAEKECPVAISEFAYSVFFQAKVLLTLLPLTKICKKAPEYLEAMTLVRTHWSWLKKSQLKKTDLLFLIGMCVFPLLTKVAVDSLRILLRRK